MDLLKPLEGMIPSELLRIKDVNIVGMRKKKRGIWARPANRVSQKIMCGVKVHESGPFLPGKIAGAPFWMRYSLSFHFIHFVTPIPGTQAAIVTFDPINSCIGHLILYHILP
jgi:hypothetical protein